MPDKNTEPSAGWTLARRISLIYGLATTVGFFYATAYFGHFDIDILNYVAPIDLLFISLEHIDRVVLIALVLTPIALLTLVVGMPATLLLTYACAIAITALIVLVILAGFRLLVFFLVATQKLVRVFVSRVLWVRKRGRITIAKADKIVGSRRRPKWLFGFRARLVDHAEDVLVIASTITGETVNVLKGLWKTTRDVKKRIRETYIGKTTVISDRGASKDRARARSWSELHWPPRFAAAGLGLLLLAILVAVAAQVGTVDATILEHNEKCQLDVLELEFNLRCYSGEVTRPLADIVPSMTRNEETERNNVISRVTDLTDFFVPMDVFGRAIGLSWEIPLRRHFLESYGPQLEPHSTDEVDEIHPKWEKIFSIPNANLASLEFSSCNGKREGSRKYARPNFRHDAGNDTRRGTPECLVYLGATGSMQFLAQFSDDVDSKRKGLGRDETTVVVYDGGGRGQTTPVVIRAGGCEEVAVVGPFVSGGHRLECVDDGCSRPGELGCPRCGEVSLCSERALAERISELGDRVLRERPDRMVVIGRVDGEPISTDYYESNFALAQARADWVDHQFAQIDWAKDVHRMAIPGGPANPADIERCDRVVEVHICWTQRGGERTDAAVDAVDAGNGASQAYYGAKSGGERPLSWT